MNNIARIKVPSVAFKGYFETLDVLESEKSVFNTRKYEDVTHISPMYSRQTIPNTGVFMTGITAAGSG